ncbi:MAG TPA: hypothetical protein VGC21_06650 [Telluria sp.]
MNTEATGGGNPPSNTAPVLAVHLIHGTWPQGPFAIRRFDHATWISTGSAFLECMTEQIRHPVVFTEFNWCGRNSFHARAAAALRFCEHIQSAMRAHPRARHVVLAHSHGGTIAMHALGLLQHQPAPVAPIPLAIFMSTPFAYLKDAERNHLVMTLFSFACISSQLALHLFGHSLPRPVSDFPHTAAYLGVALFYVVFGLLQQCQPELGHGFKIAVSIPDATRVLVMRGTRDEASLAIGLGQAIHSSGDIFFNYVNKFRIKNFLVYLLVLTIVQTLFGEDLTIILLGVVGISGFLLLCCTTGLDMISSLGKYTIEVDAVPPNRHCDCWTFDTLDTGSIRHCLYSDPQVQAAIAKSLNALCADAPD